MNEGVKVGTKHKDWSTRNVNMCLLFLKVLGRVVNGYFMTHTYKE